jgi:glycosyltransferase involved in cell wall biosynthesis
MRFHIIGLPHTNITPEFSACAYTDRIRKFCAMLKARGHTVFLYAGPVSDAICDEHIPCITEEQRAKAVEGIHYTQASFHPATPHWVGFNANAIVELGKRVQRTDFICLTAGQAQAPIAKAFEYHLQIEPMVGYGGTLPYTHKVYESYAWMHVHYGASGGTNPDGRWFDAVIPPGFELDQYPVNTGPGLHYAYLGRMIDRKGVQIAADVCEQMGLPLVTAGPGTPPAYGRYLGVVGPEQRGWMLSNAVALFVPTIYVEPFGNVAVEAMLCGTPVITSDWGAFTETVIPDVTGFRVRTLGEFKEAATLAPKLDRARIAKYARARFSQEAVGLQFEQHFARLSKLHGAGWAA